MADTLTNSRIRVAALSHRGRRENNEDQIYGASYREGPVRALLAVADGMGGYQAGEVASTIAIDTLVSSLKKSLARNHGSVDVNQLSQEIVEEISKNVAAKSAEMTERRGMGTTLCFAVVTPSGFFVGNVGDSRAYLIRGDGIQQVSCDHTVYFEMLRSGKSPAEAARNPYAHHITRSITGRKSPKADTYPEDGGLLSLEPGDVLLLCTDGLTNTVREQEIVDQIRSTGNLSLACHNLASLAYLKGGTDNISVVAMEAGEYPRQPEVAESLPSIDALSNSLYPQRNGEASARKGRPLWLEILILGMLLAYFAYFLLIFQLS